MNYRKHLQWPFFAMFVPMVCLSSCQKNTYEVLERSYKEVANFRGPGTHAEVDYTLLHEGHRFYATCDIERFHDSDPNNSCGFRPLRTYGCVLGRDGITNGDPWDLKCKDADGYNVYLYVNKKE
jgi:hypothetical protein